MTTFSTGFKGAPPARHHTRLWPGSEARGRDIIEGISKPAKGAAKSQAGRWGSSPTPRRRPVAPPGRKHYGRAAAAPMPRTRKQAVPAVTRPRCPAPPARTGRAVLLASGILLPEKITVKGARYVRAAAAMALRATLEQ